jgi:hypothetical protein
MSSTRPQTWSKIFFVMRPASMPPAMLTGMNANFMSAAFVIRPIRKPNTIAPPIANGSGLRLATAPASCALLGAAELTRCLISSTLSRACP